MEIGKRHTKTEIFTFYANQALFGHGTYGVGVCCAPLLLARPQKRISLEEAALLAGIIQAPARQSPYVNLRRRHGPRNVRAAAHGRRGGPSYRPSPTRPSAIVDARRSPRSRPASRRFSSRKFAHLKQYGAKARTKNGLSVTTTLDAAMQVTANRALAAGLRGLDKRRGYRTPWRASPGRAPHDRRLQGRLPEPRTDGGRRCRACSRRHGSANLPAVRTAPPLVATTSACEGRFASRPATAWTHIVQPPADLVKAGDLIQADQPSRSTMRPALPSVGLEQTPIAEGRC